MGKVTEVSYAHHTWNSWIGCTRVSPGCQNCFAEEMMDHHWHRVKWGPQGKRVRTSKKYWKQLHEWNALGYNQRVLVPTLCDVFEIKEDQREEMEQWQLELFRIMEDTPNLTYMLLTKRPENILTLIPYRWCTNGLPQNIWFGISTERQKEFDERIRIMDNFARALNPSVVFISAAPLLGPINISGYTDFLKWVICEGESGRNYRTLDISWANDLRAQCKEFGIPFYMKQDSGLNPGRQGRLPDDLWNCKEFPNPTS